MPRNRLGAQPCLLARPVISCEMFIIDTIDTQFLEDRVPLQMFVEEEQCLPGLWILLLDEYDGC
jgi:hypothetical protein